MAKKRMNKILAFAMAAVTAMTAPMACVSTYAATDMSLDEYEDILDTYSIDDSILSYEEYLALYADAARPDKEIYIPGNSDYRYLDEDGKETTAEIVDGYNGKGDSSHQSVLVPESGAIEYTFKVDEPGFYDLELEYFPTTEGGNSAAIQRGFFLDGKLPFEELAMVELQRVWINEIQDEVVGKDGVTLRDWEKDNQGNDMKPSLVEAPEWVNSKLYDSEGYITEALSLYLEAGEHTISIVSIREPMIIHSLTFKNDEPLLSYEEYKAQGDALGYQDATEGYIRIEAENADKTSSQMLYPVQDQSSPAVFPSSAKELLNNSIGGNSWRMTGQWIEWEFEVTESGYYQLSLFDKQNFVKGTYVSRKISVDGVVPFEEFSDYGFKYKQSWRYETMSDANGNPYKIYLEAGKHTIRMEVVLGEFSEIIGNVQECVSSLNAIYRKVIRITGVAPDTARDYQIEKNLPELQGELEAVYALLSQTILDLRAAAGKTSDKETVLITMKDQLEDLIKDQEKFVRLLSDFKVNVRACGNWVTTAIEQPLQIDTLYLTAPDKDDKVKDANWFEQFIYELKRLFYSFIIDYNQVGNVADGSEEKVITLWVGTGRDQANVIKSLIDETFKVQEGISVNVMLVDMSTLLQATLAGQGPDVAIQVGNDLPMNYGIRNAALDLTQFADLEEVKDRFHDSAFDAFEFNGATYALPETQTFPVMFYRKDILAEIGLELPQTWDDVKAAMSTLDDNQMEFGMLPAEQIFAMMLYQAGGTYYNADGSKSELDNDIAVSVFKDYCEFYTDYTLDQTTSVEERFRTGEAPLIIADYTVYNNLQVSAPDIKGLWSFTQVPGVLQEDGTINRSVGSTGTASIIMSATDDPESSWKFLKWWSSAETQIAYGKEMESLMGASARVATANIEAFAAMPWPKSDFEALTAAFEWTQGIRQVPGSYYTWRNINNAFYSVTTQTDTVSPREELMDKVLLINEELTFKRKEFDLPLATD